MNYDSSTESLNLDGPQHISRLPHWVATSSFPAVYDSESNTAIEMVAKLYGSMQRQIDSFNGFIDNINNSIAQFEADINADQDQFKTCITNLMENYIKQIDMKTDDAVAYMKTNLSSSLNELVTSGQIIITSNYDSTTESLNFIFSEGEGGTE